MEGRDGDGPAQRHVGKGVGARAAERVAFDRHVGAERFLKREGEGKDKAAADEGGKAPELGVEVVGEDGEGQPVNCARCGSADYASCGEGEAAAFVEKCLGEGGVLHGKKSRRKHCEW